MLRLIHYSLCPFSRSIRLALGECDMVVELEEERPWAWRRDFLVLNPAGTLPVLVRQQGFVLAGAYAISEYLAETNRKMNGSEHAHDVLFPGSAIERAEIRRLADWFHVKMDEEATRYFLEERVYQRFCRSWPLEPGYRYHPGRPCQSALSHGLYEPSARPAPLARWRYNQLCRSRRRCSFLGAGLSRRNPLGRFSEGEILVSLHEIAAIFQAASCRSSAGRAAAADLCGAGILKCQGSGKQIVRLPLNRLVNII